METWKAIPGYEGYYEASTFGRVRSVERTVVLLDKLGNKRPCVYKSKILKPHISGYPERNILPRCQVVLSKDGKTRSVHVHRIVAATFLPNPYGLETVNHIDGNPENNSVDNLEWLSREDNNRHAFKNNLIHTMKPVTVYDGETNEPIKTYPSASEAARRMGMQQTKLSAAARSGKKYNGYFWRYKAESSVKTVEWLGVT